MTIASPQQKPRTVRVLLARTGGDVKKRYVWPEGMTAQNFILSVRDPDTDPPLSSLRLALAEKGLLPHGVVMRPRSEPDARVELELMPSDCGLPECPSSAWQMFFYPPKQPQATLHFIGLTGAWVTWTATPEMRGRDRVPFNVDVPPGLVSYQVEHEAMRWHGATQSEPGHIKEVEIKRPSRPRKIRFLGKPAIADIAWSDSKQNQGALSPGRIVESAADSIRYEISAEGYKKAAGVRNFGSNDPFEVDIDFELELLPCRLVIAPRPVRATIRWRLQDRPEQKHVGRLETELPAGSLIWCVEHPGYTSQQGKEELTPGETYEPKVELQPERRNPVLPLFLVVVLICIGVYADLLPGSRSLRHWCDELWQTARQAVGAASPEAITPDAGEPAETQPPDDSVAIPETS